MITPIGDLILTIIMLIILGALFIAGLMIVIVATNSVFLEKHFKKFFIMIISIIIITSSVIGYKSLTDKPVKNTYKVAKITNDKYEDSFIVTYIVNNKLHSTTIDSEEIKLVEKGNSKITIIDYKWSLGGYVIAKINKNEFKKLIK